MDTENIVCVEKGLSGRLSVGFDDFIHPEAASALRELPSIQEGMCWKLVSNNAKIAEAARALFGIGGQKKIGIGEFKRIVRENS